ncbi:15961_t:CDS:2 [Racocetra persica]|uniref:15961_t:CDS:1 n=1 Tax=Racocetra persica TaxID=160502 RepID=A0ACA9LDW8_9GLOM|nr:15961_t:CDS:2 [Racocetra persica]
MPSQNFAGHLLGPLWQAFYPVQTDKKPKAKCIFCSPDKPISSTAAVMIRDSIPIQDQQLDISLDKSITPSMSALNCLIASIQANHFFSPPLPVDINKSNNLLLEAIIEGGAPLSFVELKKFKQFVYSINTHYHVLARKQLSNKILDDVYKKDTFDKSQNSMVIFRDLENTVIQVGIEKINAIITDRAANYIHMKAMFNQQYPRILSLPYTAHESNLLVGDMLKHTYMKSTISLTMQNNKQYLKDAAYEMGSRLDKYIVLILKDNARMQITVNTIDDNTFQQYISTRIQYRWNRIYSSVFLICWSLHPKYTLAQAICPELATLIKKEASNWDDYLIKDPVYFWNNFQSEISKLALFAS